MHRYAFRRMIVMSAIGLLILSAPAAESRTISFAGNDWIVKTGRSLPGPNNWSDSVKNVWLDNNGWLHLKIRPEGITWYSSEIYAESPTGYGKYCFYVTAPLDNMDKNIAVSFSLSENRSDSMGILFSRKGKEASSYNAEYFVKTLFKRGDYSKGFKIKTEGLNTTHYIDWGPEKIQFKSIHGFYAEPKTRGFLINEWAHVSRMDMPAKNKKLRARISAYLENGRPPSDKQEFEIILTDVSMPQPAK